MVTAISGAFVISKSGNKTKMHDFRGEQAKHSEIWGTGIRGRAADSVGPVHVRSVFQWCLTLCDPVTPGTEARQAPLSIGFFRQEHWSGLPFPSLRHESEIIQSCLTLSDPMDCSLLGSSVQGIFQARVLESGVIAFSKEKHTGHLCQQLSHVIQ